MVEWRYGVYGNGCGVMIRWIECKNMAQPVRTEHDLAPITSSHREVHGPKKGYFISILGQLHPHTIFLDMARPVSTENMARRK
jgi:hypothetical protein